VYCVGLDIAGIAHSTEYPWNLDQDVDCDGAANFADNCPTTYNPSQRDADSDTAGNACDPAPSENACSGDGPPANGFRPCWVRSQGHDHDLSCNDPVSAAAGIPEFADLDSTPPFGEGVCTITQDSSDDGILDLSVGAFFPGAGAGHEDINSDSDHDGCPDKDESDGDATCGMGSDPDLDGDGANVYDPDQDNDSTLDGAEDRNGNAIADWRDSIIEEPQTASNNFNSDGSPDSDGDGCSNRREALAVDASGGNRDALNPYDFYDVPTPTSGPPGANGRPTIGLNSIRNKQVALVDLGVVLSYVGRSVNDPDYQADRNADGIADGRQMDRTPGPGNNEGPPNGAVTLQDVLVILDHVGDNCAGTP
jgi:hypothetical protein